MLETSVEMLNFILSRKPNVNRKDTMQRTALHFACKAGRTEFIAALVVVKGIKMNERTCGGDTSLMYAV